MFKNFLPFSNGAWVKSGTDLKAAQDEAISILGKRAEIQKMFAGTTKKPSIIIQGENCRVIFR